MSNSKSMFKAAKLFDCNDMPDDIQKKFYQFCRDFDLSNDCAIVWEMRFGTDERGVLPEDGQDIYDIDQWLIANGAPNGDTHEIVIKHWW